MRISDLDSWIRKVIRIVTKIELIGPWAMPYPSVIRWTDKLTDKQTEVKT